MVLKGGGSKRTEREEAIQHSKHESHIKKSFFYTQLRLVSDVAAVALGKLLPWINNSRISPPLRTLIIVHF